MLDMFLEKKAITKKTEERFVNSEGNLVNGDKGYARVTHTYNESGLETETHYFDTEGNPVAVNGTAWMSIEYDAAGNKTIYR